MVDIVKLKTAMLEANVTSGDMAAVCGVSPSSWFNKVSGRSDFTVSEAEAVKAALNLSPLQVDAIFFTKKGE